MKKNKEIIQENYIEIPKEEHETRKKKYLEKVWEKNMKRPRISVHLPEMILACIFFALSVGLIGGSHGTQIITWTDVGAKVLMAMFTILSIQLAVIFSSITVLSRIYAFHCVGCTLLAFSSIIDIGLFIYYIVILT